VVDIRIPLRRNQQAAYLKYQTAERPTVGVAVVYDVAAGRCRVAVGAAGQVPVVQTCGSPDQVDVTDLADRVDPVADLTGSVEYKRHMTAVFVRRALHRLTA
jgi:carbon-monoxide dehydrogenase medium subunit